MFEINDWSELGIALWKLLVLIVDSWQQHTLLQIKHHKLWQSRIPVNTFPNMIQDTDLLANFHNLLECLWSSWGWMGGERFKPHCLDVPNNFCNAIVISFYSFDHFAVTHNPENICVLDDCMWSDYSF